VIDHAVLIAGAGLLPALKARLAREAGELLAFTDAEALRALEAITTRRPPLVILEQKFAATPRGAALINRIKADASLVETEVRVVPHEMPRDTAPGASAAITLPHTSGTRPSHTHPTPVPSAELDFSGTRRSPRYRIRESREVLVDGNRGNLVDLSTVGAQLLTATILKPNQRVRVTLTDEVGTIRCGATVVWASFEIPKGVGPRYRVGLDFIDPDAAAIDAYTRRHKES